MKIQRAQLVELLTSLVAVQPNCKFFSYILLLANCIQDAGTIEDFMYRRPTLYTLQIAVDFLKSL
jgi:hypothetical protein